ncbi:MAG: tetratricopeptide repeat protein [Rhodothermaceae bacterium]|nr:tetratricopeptide repeat protein [Rhodothermaceae bacterium]
MQASHTFALRLGGALALLVALAVGQAGCRTDEVEPPALGVQASAYVGDEACEQCHADLYASYHATGMGRSVSRFDPDTAPEQLDGNGASPLVCHEPSGYCYQAILRGDTLVQRETRPDTPGYERLYAVSHVVGSGNATRSYFMTVGIGGEEGGYVTEMPLTWYVERAVWDLSPGYAQTNSRFERPIVLECMTCHNAQPGFAVGAQNFYTEVPLGITCERCHGPGEAHVEARLITEDVEGPDPTIVNPARLEAGLRLAVCQQCHLTGKTVFVPGEDPTTYRPGTPLSDHRTVYVKAEQLEDPERFGISSHALRMMQSLCYTASQGTERPLTCTTCHDPHQPTAELGADHFNAVCQSCHGGEAHDAVCARPAADSRIEAMTGDCVSCHMRTSGTDDIPHVTFTDHWIRRTLPPAVAPESIERGVARATPFQLVDATAREARLAGAEQRVRSAAEAAVEEGLAYWALYETEHALPAYLPDIVARIREGLAGGAERPEARVVLGRALADMNAQQEAEQVLAEAITRHPEDAPAHFWLGEVRLRRGDARAAIEPLQRAVALAPAFTEAHVKLADALAAAGQSEAAIARYREAVRRDPVRHPDAWNNLGFQLFQAGRFEEATAALQEAVALDPTLLEARTNLGAALLSSDDLNAAAEQFEAILRYEPAYLAAIGNLGVIRMRQERPAEARRHFEHLLRLSPGNPQATAYLQQLDAL